MHFTFSTLQGPRQPLSFRAGALSARVSTDLDSGTKYLPMPRFQCVLKLRQRRPRSLSCRIQGCFPDRPCMVFAKRTSSSRLAEVCRTWNARRATALEESTKTNLKGSSSLIVLSACVRREMFTQTSVHCPSAPPALVEVSACIGEHGGLRNTTEVRSHLFHSENIATAQDNV